MFSALLLTLIRFSGSMAESHNLFTDVLNRREKAEAMRVALYALQRHRFLFSLPNSITKDAEKEKYDIILSDYTRAQKLFGKSEIAVSCRTGFPESQCQYPSPPFRCSRRCYWRWTNECCRCAMSSARRS